MGGIKKHKKHKSDRKDRPLDGQLALTEKLTQPALKLILKVGSSSTTPEHSNEWTGPSAAGQSLPFAPSYSVQGQDEESVQSVNSANFFMGPPNSHHKKSKKKKKKKEKSKDKERKHRHHHKDKKRKKEESSQDEISFNEDSLTEPAVGSPNPLNREPRLCVIRQRQERSSLQKLLEHLLKVLEKRDPQNFFAWPVTDNIAPGKKKVTNIYNMCNF